LGVHELSAFDLREHILYPDNHLQLVKANGIDFNREVVVRKQLKRSLVHRFFANPEPCLTGMEACGGAHYWSRELTGPGHTVRVMAPIFVKPYLKTNKNDCNDAEAICDGGTTSGHALYPAQDTRAAGRPASPSCSPPAGSPAGCPEQSHARDSLGVRHRSAARGQNDLTAPACAAGRCRLIERVERLEGQIKAWHATNPASQRLASIPGIGVLAATALAAALGEGQDFRSGR
jgi:transposase